ncbi:MAG: CoA-binding protein [Leptonema illini]|jgi:predicted CoA-binding protein|uniref:CoA-binding protein n=1 Tax=Leptonema illini TaxID=183 RepID=A0A833GZI8_9LEPT|nr:MAG: CoA-binding protein [Leptonema illini]
MPGADGNHFALATLHFPRFADSMELDLVSHLRSNPGIALVGATNDSTKYGNIIFRDLRKKNYTVYPVNPRATTVEGEAAFKNLESLIAEKSVGLVVYVIPPKLTLEGLKIAESLGLKKVWVQPGAGDETVRAYLDEHGFEYLMDACVMVQTR